MLLINPSNKQLNKIESFVFNNPNGNFFQSTYAYKFFRSVNNYEPILIIAEENDDIVGSLLAVIIIEGNGIKSYFSRRCIVWGGPIVLCDSHEIYSRLLLELNKFVSQKVIYIEFRNLNNLSQYKILFENVGYQFNEHLNLLVKIPSIEVAKANMSKSKKRQISQSLKNGCEIVEADILEQVIKFYNILENLYKKKVKKPLPPFDLFKRFFDYRELGKYLLIKHNNVIVGGIMCPIYKDTIYEWFVCGLDGEIVNIYPSVLATWAPIEYAAKHRLKYFDFMGAGRPGEDYGVREFKSKFGGELVNYGRFIKINYSLLYNMGKIGLRILKKIQ